MAINSNSTNYRKNESIRSKVFLQREFRRLQEKGNEHFSVGISNDDYYTWDIIIFGPADTLYENGIFRAKMIFPMDYPEMPPTFKFISEMYHPNIDKNGQVCISILHAGDDEYGYENTSERWMPVRNPESVIISIVSLLSSPNCDSPANIDAARDFRENPAVYKQKVLRCTQKSLE
ncbi:Ubiquitin-conjugating enzyme E2 G1 [Dictyocoela roeselum]|nr:Ubiquitin-conjugating enzyme E2 G1 [Dictyocoela roeselum]